MTYDPVRDEAERLVAAAISAISLAARGLPGAGPRSGRGGAGFATGSPECCVCPVCRVISAMRDPGVDVADRLAAGAGDLASAVASVLRAFGGSGGARGGTDREASREGDEFWESLRRRARGEEPPAGADESHVEDPWRSATAMPATPPPKPMAKKAVKKAAPAKAPAARTAAAAKAPAKKASAKAAPAKAATPAVAKKAAKKTVKKAAKAQPPGAAE